MKIKLGFELHTIPGPELEAIAYACNQEIASRKENAMKHSGRPRMYQILRELPHLNELGLARIEEEIDKIRYEAFVGKRYDKTS